jgi:oligosaccharide repeat unit polymerase
MATGDILWFLAINTLAIVLLTVARRRYGDHMTPLGIFVGINSLSLAAYHLRLLEYYDVSMRTHLIIMLSLLSFSAAVLICLPNQKNIDSTKHFAVAPSDKIFYLVAGMSILGWILSLYILVIRYGVSHLLANAWILEKEFQMQFIGYLNLFGILIMPMLVARRLLGVVRRIDVFLVILTLVGLLLAGVKQYIIFTSVSSVVVFSVLRPGRIGIKHMVIVLVAVILFFVCYDAVVDIFGSRLFPGSQFPASLSFLERPYLYLTGSWPAMDKLVSGEGPPQPVLGYITLQPIWKLLGDGLGIVEPVERFLPFLDIGAHGFNVYSFCGEVFWDYGVVGVVLVSFLLGWFMARLYAAARSGRHWVYPVAYGLMAYGLVLSFFSYYYRFELLLLTGLVLLLGLVLEPLLFGGDRYEQ